MSHSTTALDTVSRQRAIHAKCVHPSGAFREFKLEEIEQSVPSRLESIVRAHPERLAVKGGNEELTYDELNRAANRIANALLRQRGPKEEPIGVLIEESPRLITAILGVLKAGKICVPLATYLPESRLAYVCQDAQAAVILTNDQNLSFARELGAQTVPALNVDQIDSKVSDENPGLDIPPDTLAYILYTSGSTGRPKGVVDNHRNILLEVLRVTNKFHICPEDRMALLQSCAFSGSVRKLYPALLNGATLLHADQKKEGALAVAKRLLQEDITVMSKIKGFGGGLPEGATFPKVRVLSAGGQTIYRSDIEFWWKYLPAGAVQVVSYGITEAGGVSHYFIDRETELPSVSPVGYETEYVEVLLLDEDGREVGEGEAGEIVVKSRYMSPGYWRRPDLTEKAYLRDPAEGDKRLYRTGDLGRRLPDGCLVHLGRKDFQVKIRGYRVEMQETEAALMELQSVERAVVVAREDSPGEKYLAGYFVPAGRPAPTATALRRDLEDRLPEYMIPSTFVALEELPLTATGKVDRLALPAPESVRPELDTPFSAPRDAVEEKLAQIWAEVLGLDRVGIDDDFLDLGGDSMKAAKLISRVLQTFDAELSMRALFDAPTVAEMCETIKGLGEKIAGGHSMKEAVH